HRAALAVVECAGDVEQLLELLRRRSLLEWDAALERYSLHELVHTFVAVRLADVDAVRLRHAQYYVQVAESARWLYLQGDEALLGGLELFGREWVHIDTG